MAPLIPEMQSRWIHRLMRILCRSAKVNVVWDGETNALMTALGVACAAAVGLAVALWRTRRRWQAAVGERGWLLERERESATRAAVEAERDRIARELHDIVSHNVSLMVVQAGAAREVLGTMPDEAAAALRAVEDAGRGAMTDLRHLLGLLAPSADGEDEEVEHGPARGVDSVELVPQPGLDRLGALVDRISFAGLPVEVRISGEPRPLPQGVDVTAYRIVQEALTNALRHGDGGKAEVTVRYADHALRVEVLNTGSSVLTGAAPARTSPRHRDGTGRGLLGLRERVAVYAPGPPVTAAERTPRVLVADDQTLIRTGFRLILTARGIEVVGEAADGAEAVVMARELVPDVVLMDIRMPNMDGLEATRRILEHTPGCRVLMLTTFDLDRYVYTALSVGASGFLLKDVTPEHLAAAGATPCWPRPSPGGWWNASRPTPAVREPSPRISPP